ncbi:MAG: hypothetical protein ACP5XB_27150 [Isosphaeraceae bacterium]
MKILDRLPFADRPQLITVRGEAVDVFRNQIIVWISINDESRPMPAILDTGHGHNLSIGEAQLKRWSGASLKRIGELEIGHKRVVQHEAVVRLHRNLPGKPALRGDSIPLEMPQGISVFPDGEAPRLPLIGLRTIVANKLVLVVDGERRQATLKTKGWF